MAGAFSGHLVDSFSANTSFNPSISTHGAMSFNPMMHGIPFSQQSFASPFNSQSLFPNESISEETAKKIATLQVKLDQKLGPEYISQRPGPGGGPKLTYVEGWKIINLANEIFGFNGWSSNIVSLTTDFADYSEETRRYNVGVTAIMRVTLRDGVYHEDIGYGMLENSKSKAAALDKCKKEAVTDGLKRALRNFGNVLGNCLYDKSYTSEVIKVKFEPPKFNKDVLHRRPEFEDVKPNVAAVPTPAPPAANSNNNMHRPPQGNQNASSRPPIQQAGANSVAPIPQHMRTEVRASGSTSNSKPTVVNNLPHQAINSALQTPMYSNSHQQPITPITPSNTNNPAQRVTNPQQHAQQSERRVSFSEPAHQNPNQGFTKQEEDDYGFNSDDDAILAMADLGPPIGADDVDMGRPIEADLDSGRPIDHEEGLSRPIEDASTERAPQNMSRTPDASKSRQELIEAALRGDLDPVPVQRSGSVPSAAGSSSTSSATGATGGAAARATPTPPQAPTNAAQGLSRISGSSTGTTSSSSMGPPPVPLHQQSSRAAASTSYPQQQYQRYVDRKQQVQDQNVAPQTNGNTQAPSLSSANAGDAGVKRSQMSSAGSFRFPPGMNPLQSGNNSGQGVVAPTIGIKRPAEAMGPPSTARGGRPGMGLQQATANVAPNGQRQVLGALEVGEGGDVKRRRW